MYPVDIPPCTLYMLENCKNWFFFEKKLETVWNIPKCDEKHRCRQKPEKNCQKVNTLPPSTRYMQKSKNKNFIPQVDQLWVDAKPLHAKFEIRQIIHFTEIHTEQMNQNT